MNEKVKGFLMVLLPRMLLKSLKNRSFSAPLLLSLAVVPLLLVTSLISPSFTHTFSPHPVTVLRLEAPVPAARCSNGLKHNIKSYEAKHGTRHHPKYRSPTCNAAYAGGEQ
jgi:hypothetical protein